MFGQVPEEVKDARLQQLQQLLREQQIAFNRSKIGQTVPVLITGKGRNPGQAHGRSPWLQAVHFELPHDQAMTIADLIGTIVDVRVIDASLNSLSGELVKVREAAL